MLLRVATIAFFALLLLLPLILRLWRGQTSQDRGAAARAEVETAERRPIPQSRSSAPKCVPPSKPSGPSSNWLALG